MGISSEWNPDESARGRNQYGFLDVTVSNDLMTVTMVNERGQITHSGNIKPLVNTPKQIEDVAKTQKYVDGKIAAWHKAIDAASGARSLAAKATEDREEADRVSAEKAAAEKEALYVLQGADVALEKADADVILAQQFAAEKAQAERDAKANGASTQVLDEKAAEKDAADQALADKKAAAKDAYHAKTEADRVLKIATSARTAADKTAGFKLSVEHKALGTADALEKAAEKAEQEKKAGESELAAKQAGLKT